MINVVFMGRKPVAAHCLEFLLGLESVKVVAVLTDSHLSVSLTADVARANGIACLEFEEALSLVENGALDFDLGLSMLYWRRLKGRLLSKPLCGLINFHPAPLPDFKGVGGYNLAVLNGLSEWAVTAHYVDEEIDTGPIIDVVRFPIDPDAETVKSIEESSQRALFSLFCKVVALAVVSSGKLPTRPNGKGMYLSRPELEAMKRIDLMKDDVARKVRAFWFPPYDGAFLEIDGYKFTLVDRSILQSLADPDVSSLFSAVAANKHRRK